jgi:polysaccharide export outer membrane protein
MRALTFDQKQSSLPAKAEPQQIATVDLKGLLESGDSSLNVPVYPGDRITVARAGIIYVVGAVNKPGGFIIRSGSRETTVLQAIALAENAKGTAKPADSVIIRNDPNAPGGRVRLPVDLKKVLSGKSPDPGLQAEDILFVPDSSGKRILHRSIESILQVTTGVAIYSARF